MNDQMNAPVPPSAGNSNAQTMAIASLVIGVINLCAWLLPICGFPLGIVGLVLGYFGMKDPSRKNLAIGGMALSGIGILLACVNAIAGAVLNADLYRQILQGFGQ
ncbi:MAG TPA: DUF4190 domain-containing protein [Anaerolineales bacterium]|nr:DUF4190 domain-containing protein [Anaerolineales bacterium]